MIGPLERITLAILVIVLMVGMGATLSLQSFKAVLREPKGIIVGLLSQFGWMPLVAYLLSSFLDLAPAFAIGLLIIGSTPGGTTSNLFTYYSKADVALSISMTVVSTVVAVIAMPLLLAGYAAGYEDTNFVVPMGSIASTLAVVLVPVSVGMLVRAKKPYIAPKLERFGSLAGVAVLVLLVVSAVARNHSIFPSIPWTVYAASVSLGVIGFSLGYIASRVAGLDAGKRRAVTLETGIQNSPLAFAIILACLPESMQDQSLITPMLYALFVLITASVVTWFFRRANPTAPVATTPN